ncbi:MAG: MBL fold metallo-hydrolase [Nostocoides sp.]
MNALPAEWIRGSVSAKHNTDPDLQIHHHDPATVILRQNMAVHYEAPFLYLLLGTDRALLLDTGATAKVEYLPLRPTVDRVLGDWLAAHPRAGYELVVAHTHSHSDHIAGDVQFADRPLTRVVPPDAHAAYDVFGLDPSDLDRTTAFDLGGRTVTCIASPGHDAAAITFHDDRTGFLLTGDTVYPGRLYVEDWAAYAATIDRLIAFADAGDHPVSAVLGCHIEMSATPGVDHPIRTVHHPDEAPLAMTVDHLRAVATALAEIGDHPGRYVYEDFVVVCAGSSTGRNGTAPTG